MTSPQDPHPFEFCAECDESIAEKELARARQESGIYLCSKHAPSSTSVLIARVLPPVMVILGAGGLAFMILGGEGKEGAREDITQERTLSHALPIEPEANSETAVSEVEESGEQELQRGELSQFSVIEPKVIDNETPTTTPVHERFNETDAAHDTLAYVRKIRKLSAQLDSELRKASVNADSDELFGIRLSFYLSAIEDIPEMADPEFVDCQRGLAALTSIAAQGVPSLQREAVRGLKQDLSRAILSGFLPEASQAGPDAYLDASYRLSELLQRLAPVQSRIVSRLRELQVTLPEDYKLVSSELQDELGGRIPWTIEECLQARFQPEYDSEFSPEATARYIRQGVMSNDQIAAIVETSHLLIWSNAISFRVSNVSFAERALADRIFHTSCEGVHPAVVRYAESALLWYKRRIQFFLANEGMGRRYLSWVRGKRVEEAFGGAAIGMMTILPYASALDDASEAAAAAAYRAFSELDGEYELARELLGPRQPIVYEHWLEQRSPGSRWLPFLDGTKLVGKFEEDEGRSRFELELKYVPVAGIEGFMYWKDPGVLMRVTGESTENSLGNMIFLIREREVLLDRSGSGLRAQRQMNVFLDGDKKDVYEVALISHGIFTRKEIPHVMARVVDSGRSLSELIPD